jgi:hypothetical protein
MKKRIIPLVILFFLLCWIPCLFNCSKQTINHHPIVFTTFIELKEELLSLKVMVESLRTFGGKYKNAPVWIYTTNELMASESEALAKFASLNVEFRASQAPQDATWFFLARKVFAAAQAESDTEGKAAILARLDTDTIFIQEPDEYILPESKSLGYRPVFHRNINPLYSEPLDEYWARAYQIMDINESTAFPMVTPADGDTIRPYFQAGCIVVRPKQGILRKWAEMFAVLYQDSVIKELCKQDQRKRIFTFQVALTGAILNNLDRSEMIEFSDRINYPIFFREMFGAKRDFHDISNAVTIRYEHFFVNPPKDWDKQLNGPEDRIAWIKERFSK